MTQNTEFKLPRADDQLCMLKFHGGANGKTSLFQKQATRLLQYCIMTINEDARRFEHEVANLR